MQYEIGEQSFCGNPTGGCEGDLCTNNCARGLICIRYPPEAEMGQCRWLCDQTDPRCPYDYDCRVSLGDNPINFCMPVANHNELCLQSSQDNLMCRQGLICFQWMGGEYRCLQECTTNADCTIDPPRTCRGGACVKFP
jgi:hypothetical protein